MESNNNNSNQNIKSKTIFTPIARGIKIEDPEVFNNLDEILSNDFKKHYFSEIKNKKNKN